MLQFAVAVAKTPANHPSYDARAVIGGQAHLRTINVAELLNDAPHAWAPPSLWEDSAQFVDATQLDPNCVGPPLVGILMISIWLCARGAQRTVKMIKEAGGEASCIAADMSVPRQVEMMVDNTVATYGRLDCAFNNAGIEGKMADTAEYPEEMFDRIMAINLKGVWLCIRYEIPWMLNIGGGAIVNTASGAGLVGVAQLSAYNASKHGVVGD